MEKIKLKVGDIFNFTKVGYLYYKTKFNNSKSTKPA